MRLLLAALAALAFAAPARAADTLTVVTLNLWHDQQDWNRRRSLILDELRALAPDVICLQEVLQHETLLNQARDIAETLHYRYTFSSVDPESSAKRYGNAILVRHEMLASAWKPLAPLDDYRTAVHLRFRFHGKPVDVFNTHLHHTGEGGKIRTQQIADLLAWLKPRAKGAVILAGDFNAAPRAPEMATILAAFDDTFAALHPAISDTATTLNPHKGHSPRRIDYLFVPKKGRRKLTPVSSEIILDQPGPDGTWPSDHFGVVTRIAFPR